MQGINAYDIKIEGQTYCYLRDYCHYNFVVNNHKKSYGL